MHKLRRSTLTCFCIVVCSTVGQAVAGDSNESLKVDLCSVSGRSLVKPLNSGMKSYVKLQNEEWDSFNLWLREGKKRLSNSEVPQIKSNELYFVGYMSKDGKLLDFSSAEPNYLSKSSESDLEARIAKIVFEAVSPNPGFHPLKPIRVEFKLNVYGDLKELKAGYTYLSHLKTSFYPAKFINHVSAANAL